MGSGTIIMYVTAHVYREREFSLVYESAVNPRMEWQHD